MTGSDTRALRRLLIIAAIVPALVRLVSLGTYPLMDTTEARYAEIARKMVELGDWITPWFDYGVPFWGKPPLSFWLTAASFKLLGIGEFAARVPHLAIAVVVAWLIWDLGRRRSEREAVYTVCLLAGSLLFFIAAGAVLTDMALLLGVVLAMRGLWLGLHGPDAARARERWLLFVGIAIGLLAKGPIVLVLAGMPLVVWTLATGSVVVVWRSFPWWRGVALTALLTLPWYVAAELKTPGFLDYFLVGEHIKRFLVSEWPGDRYGSAHEFMRGTIWGFNVLAALPWSVLLPPAALWWWRSRRSGGHVGRSWLLYLACWALAPAVFFTASANILATYVLPGLPALALLGAAWLAHVPQQAGVRRLLLVGVLVCPALMLAFVVYVNSTDISDMRSARAVVAAYGQRAEPGVPLVFYPKRPFSAEFYSRGEARLVRERGRLSELAASSQAFVGMAPERFDQMPPADRDHFRPVTEKGAYALLRTMSAGGQNAGRKSEERVARPLRWCPPHQRGQRAHFGHATGS